MLYNKVEGSGISCDEIPRIIWLMPEFDRAHAEGSEDMVKLEEDIANRLQLHKDVSEMLDQDRKATQKACVEHYYETAKKTYLQRMFTRKSSALAKAFTVAEPKKTFIQRLFKRRSSAATTQRPEPFDPFANYRTHNLYNLNRATTVDESLLEN